MLGYIWLLMCGGLWWDLHWFVFTHLFYNVQRRKIERNKSSHAREQILRVKWILKITWLHFRDRGDPRLRHFFFYSTRPKTFPMFKRGRILLTRVCWENLRRPSNEWKKKKSKYTKLNLQNNNLGHAVLRGHLSVLQVFILFLTLLLIDSFRNLPKFHFCLCLKMFEGFQR